MEEYSTSSKQLFMDKLLTVIVQTSPIPSHPSTALLQALFRSFDLLDGLRECRILIVADGCDKIDDTNETEGLKRGKVSQDSATRYHQHLQQLQQEISGSPFHVVEHGSVQLLILDTRHGSAKALQHVVNSEVSTPFVMICQHDNFFISKVPLRSILNTMKREPWLKACHFGATATTNYVTRAKKRYGLDIQPRNVDSIQFPFIPLVFWYGRTHVARTDYYCDFVLNREIRIGDHLEELLGERQLTDIQQNGFEAHDLYGNYVLDQGREVVYHLSGRRARAVQKQGARTDDCDLRAETEDLKDLGGQNVSKYEAWNSTASFTTARSCRAIVPGLELPPLPPPSSTRPNGKFRQRCFDCGAKGHSYRYCPDAKHTIETETIDLS